jgi:fatty acid desaturase
MWKNGLIDFPLVFIASMEFAGKISWAFFFHQLTWTENAGLAIVFAFLYYFNMIVVTHNFIHTPFFRWRWLNTSFYILNSANVFFPISLYNENHALHHAYNNDRLSSEGTTLDPTSTYLYGENGKQEHFVKYCALGVFRDWTMADVVQIRKRGKTTRFISELVAILFLVLGSAYVSWKWFLFAWIPTYLFGWFLSNMQNYYEHYRANDPENRYSNSVSYYGRIFNLLMFNEGYHQEHHIQPTAHWSKRPHVRHENLEKMQTAGFKEAQLPPILGFLLSP